MLGITKYTAYIFVFRATSVWSSSKPFLGAVIGSVLSQRTVQPFLPSDVHSLYVFRTAEYCTTQCSITPRIIWLPPATLKEKTKKNALIPRGQKATTFNKNDYS